MPYTFNSWKERLAQRSDLSPSLVHLTRSAIVDGNQLSPVDVLIKILLEKKIIGSDPRQAFIHGDRRAVCFQDAPLYSIAQNILFEKKYKKEKPESRDRYSGCGLIFSKWYVHSRGGRPVIYDSPESATAYLDRDEWWRIVALDLSDSANTVDWMHEREWRVKGDLEFELSRTAILIDTKASYREFISKCRNIAEPNILESICGIIVLSGLLDLT